MYGPTCGSIRCQVVCIYQLTSAVANIKGILNLLPSPSSCRSPLFNNCIITAIVINCIFLLWEDPVCNCELQSDHCTEAELFRRMLFAGNDCSYWPERERMLSISETFFMVLFTVEFVIKVLVSSGFWPPCNASAMRLVLVGRSSTWLSRWRDVTLCWA